MGMIGRIPAKKKDIWAEFEDAPEASSWDDFEDAPEEVSFKFSEDQINVNYEAPSSVRLELSGLKKPEDKLAALRKTYPDAEPYGDGNFIMTNPENGEVMLFNQEGWIPSVGDFAESVPTVAEIAGAIGGGIFGGAGGAAAGSAVPVVGTGAGAVGGAVAGAGAGGAGARDLAERGINWLYGNEDTRTLSEYAKDKAVDVALNAAGEGAGIALAKGAQVASRPIQKWIAGNPKDKAKALQLADDFASANIPSTTGTITQRPSTLVREAEIAKANPNSRIGQMMEITDQRIGDEFDRIATGVASNTDSALRPATGQGVGEGLIGKAGEANAALNAQRDALYRNVDNIVGGTASAGNKHTSDLLVRLNGEKKGLGASAKLNRGALLDEAVKQTKAAAGDMKAMNFGQMQEMRNQIGKLAYDKSTDPYLASRYKDLYKAITNDMADTATSAGDDAFKAWKDADAFNTSLYGPDSAKESLKGLTKASDGESAYRFITGKVKEGGSRLQSARAEIEKVPGGAAQWDQLVSTYISKIGKHAGADGAEVFSPKKFMSEWGKIAPEAKDAMFSGARAQYRSDLDRLVRIVDARQTAKSARTAPVDIGSRLIRLAGGVASFGASEAGRATYKSYMDRLLTNPEVVRWMTGIPQAQMTKGGLRQHISVLRNFAREAFKYGNGGVAPKRPDMLRFEIAS